MPREPKETRHLTSGEINQHKAILANTQTTSVQTRILSLHALRDRHNPADKRIVSKTLIQALYDPHPTVANKAKMALGSIGEGDSIKPLHKILKNSIQQGVPDIIVINALGEIGSRYPRQAAVLLPTLIGLLDPKRPSNSDYYVINALGKIGNSRASVILREFENSSRPDVSSAARKALGNIAR